MNMGILIRYAVYVLILAFFVKTGVKIIGIDNLLELYDIIAGLLREKEEEQ